MKKRWTVIAVVVIAGLVLLAGQFGRRSSVRPNTRGAPVSASRPPAAVATQRVSAARHAASEAVDVSAGKSPASSGKLRAMPPVQKSIPVRAERASPLERKLVSALAGIEAEKDPMSREKLIEAAIDELAGADFRNVFAYLQDMASNLSLDMAARLMRCWAEKDPAVAGEWALSQPKGAARQGALEQVAIVWANQDLAGAVDWAWGLPESPENNRIVRQVAYETARTVPVEALNLAVVLAADPDRDELIRYAAREWTTKDPAAAAEWASMIQDEALRNMVMAGVATVLADKDPVAAAKLAVVALPSGRAQDDAVVGIVQRWVQQDPEASATWVFELPETVMKETAMDNLVSIWDDQDTTSFDAWCSAADLGERHRRPVQ